MLKDNKFCIWCFESWFFWQVFHQVGVTEWERGLIKVELHISSFSRRYYGKKSDLIWNSNKTCKTGRKEKKGPSTAATGLHFLLVAGVVDDVAANLDCNQRWGWSSQLEATLLMAKDGVLLLSTWTSFPAVFLIKGSQPWGTGMMLLLWRREEVPAGLGERGDEGLSCNTGWKSIWWLLEVEGGPLFCWVCEMREMKGGLFFLCSA